MIIFKPGDRVMVSDKYCTSYQFGIIREFSKHNNYVRIEWKARKVTNSPSDPKTHNSTSTFEPQWEDKHNVRYYLRGKLPDSVVDKQARMYSLSFDDMHGRGFSNVDYLNLAAAETLAIPSKSKRKPKVYKPKSSHEIAFTCEKLIRDTSVHIKKIQKCEKDVYLVHNYSH